MADTEFAEQGANVWWRIHKNLVRDDRNHPELNGHRSATLGVPSKNSK
jgi:hypothetical protein